LALGCSSGSASEPNGPASASNAGSGHVESNQGNEDRASDGRITSVKQPRVVGYLPTYRFRENPVLHLDTLTHLNIAFAVPNDKGKVEFAETDPSALRRIVEQAHDAKVKVLVALAGAVESERTSDWLEKDFNAVVDSLLALVDEYQFDGIDVDIEGDHIRPATYQPLMETLSRRLAELPERKLLTAAVADYRKERYRALGTVDFLNIMAYDQCGEWSEKACEHAPLGQARSYLDYWSTFQDYDANGTFRKIGADNVVLGVPFYGRCWGEKCPNRVKKPKPDGTLSDEYYKTVSPSYADILTGCANHTFSGCSQSADILSSGDEVHGYYVSLNSPATIKAKTIEAKAHGGIMIWELGQDDKNAPLFTEIAKAFPKSHEDSQR